LTVYSLCTSHEQIIKSATKSVHLQTLPCYKINIYKSSSVHSQTGAIGKIPGKNDQHVNIFSGCNSKKASEVNILLLK